MKKINSMVVILFLTGMLCIASLFLFGHTAYRQVVSTEQDVDRAMERIFMKRDEVKEAEANYARALEDTQANIKRLKQKAETARQGQVKERAADSPDTPAASSVFDEQGTEDVFSSESAHIVAIDPGHQSETIDMSAQEPIGPGASETKPKSSAGTQGTATKIPEYALNLNVSLKLKEELEQRGYQVVMTRTDNDTAISNKERAEYATSQNAEIYVRIHANGADSPDVSGALTMCPSKENPYVPQLYEDSYRLSWDILDAYCSVTDFDKLGVQYYDNMAGINWSTIPVTILEMGFMTNENDDRKMNDEEFQRTMASGIADGIDAYFEE